MNTTKGSILCVFTVFLLLSDCRYLPYLLRCVDSMSAMTRSYESLSGMTIGKDTSFKIVQIGQHGSTVRNLQHEWIRPWNGKSQLMKTISKLSPMG